MSKLKLPAEVAEKFTLVNWVGGHRQNFGKFGVIDLTKITVDQATSLVKRGFTKLKAKTKKATSTTGEQAK